MLLLDLSHTAHSPARTGVQRVALELRRALRQPHRATPVTEITHDPFAGTWRPLQTWESASLDRVPPASRKRGASWPLRSKLTGWLAKRRAPGPVSEALPRTCDGIVFPEIFTARTGRVLPELFDNVRAPKVAVFHDAIALRLPELTPPGNVGRFPAYLDELRQFDGIAANSVDSQQALLDYWKWAHWENCPPVIALPLGCDHLSTGAPTPADDERSASDGSEPVILSVGSLEGRKNHLRLLEACERLWAAGKRFQLELIGTLQRQTGRDALARIKSLQAAGRPLHYHGWLPDAALAQAFDRCAFTVYPSIMEGFGFPVWESLRHGKPCICSDRGAIAETAAGGGCQQVDTTSVDALSEAMADLLDSPQKLTQLTHIAQTRSDQSPTWTGYADRLISWLQELAEVRKTA